MKPWLTESNKMLRYGPLRRPLGIIFKPQALIIWLSVLVAHSLGWLIIQFDDLVALAAFVGAGVLALSLLSPFIALNTIILSQTILVGGSSGITVAEGLSFGIFVLLVAYHGLAPRIVHRKDVFLGAFKGPYVTLYAACLFSLMPAIVNGVPLIQWLREFSYLFGYLVFFPAAYALRTRRQVYIVLVLCTVLYTLISLRDLQFLLQVNGVIREDVESALYLVRGGGSFFIFWFGLLFSLTLVALGHSQSQRLLALIMIGLFGLEIILSGTRVVWIGTLVGLGTWLMLVGRTRISRWVGLSQIRSVLLVATLLIVSVWFLLWFGTAESTYGYLRWRLETAVNPGELRQDWALEARLNEMRTVVDLIAKQPLTGYGLGYKVTAYTRPWSEGYHRSWYVHNSYLYFWLKMGVPGLIALLWLLISYIRFALSCLRLTGDNLLRMLSSSFAATLVALGVCSATSSQFNSAITTLFLGLFVGIMWALARQEGLLPAQKP